MQLQQKSSSLLHQKKLEGKEIYGGAQIPGRKDHGPALNAVWEVGGLRASGGGCDPRERGGDGACGGGGDDGGES